MRRRRIRGTLAGNDAIGETDPVERVAGEVESRVILLRCLDPGDPLRMTEEVLRHATRPAADRSQRRTGDYAKSRGDFLDSERAEHIVACRQGFLLSRTPDEDPDQFPSLGSPPRPFSGRPGT